MLHLSNPEGNGTQSNAVLRVNVVVGLESDADISLSGGEPCAGEEWGNGLVQRHYREDSI